MRQYDEAVRLSRKAGHRVSFRVGVDPQAEAQTITFIEEPPVEPEDAFPVEQIGEPDENLRRR